MKYRILVPILVVAAVVVLSAAAFGHLLPFSGGSHTTTAPAFTLTDIYGHRFNLSDFRNSSVVVVEFTALSCSECQVVEQSLAHLYSGYNQTGTTDVHIVSIYIEPQYGDSIPALKAYHQKNAITWTMAQDTNSLAVSQSYSVTDIPTVVVVDKNGHLVYDVSGVQDDQKLQGTISSALAGTAVAISIVTVSVFALAAVAGVTTFFSPCAFPMFPGYMSLFLGLNTPQANASESGGATTYKGAARRAVLAGSVTALGMVLVFLLVGVALILAASVVSGYIPFLMIIVGVTLIGLGALLLTNLQYWKIVTPLQRLWARLRGKESEVTVVAATPTSGKGLYVKLFGYGMGYASAAAGCVFPVIFAAIVAGLALGVIGGIVNVLIFTLTAAFLMIGVTVMLAVVERKYVNQLKALTPVIKKVSAGVLIVVGIYLIYFFYTAWGFHFSL